MFGFYVPNAIIEKRGNPVRYWGARAIFSECRETAIHLVHDRQSLECGGRDPKPLLDWLNNVAFKELFNQQGYRQLTPDCREVVEFKQGQFTIQCTPNGSYGYLYIGAWQYYPEGCEYELKELPNEEIVLPKPGQKEWPDKGLRWSNAGITVPPIGAKIVANINGEWRGTVTGYFVEHKFLGIEVECTVQPEWVVKQNRPDKRGLFFGIDLRQVEVPQAA